MLQGPVHAVQPFQDPRRQSQDLAQSQALQPVPGMMTASRAPSGAVAGSTLSTRQAQHAQQAQHATGDDETQDDLVEEPDEPASTGLCNSAAVVTCVCMCVSVCVCACVRACTL